jgi:hypothetical protein
VCFQIWGPFLKDEPFVSNKGCRAIVYVTIDHASRVGAVVGGNLGRGQSTRSIRECLPCHEGELWPSGFRPQLNCRPACNSPQRAQPKSSTSHILCITTNCMSVCVCVGVWMCVYECMCVGLCVCVCVYLLCQGLTLYPRLILNQNLLPQSPQCWEHRSTHSYLVWSISHIFKCVCTTWFPSPHIMSYTRICDPGWMTSFQKSAIMTSFSIMTWVVGLGGDIWQAGPADLGPSWGTQVASGEVLNSQWLSLSVSHSTRVLSVPPVSDHCGDWICYGVITMLGTASASGLFLSLLQVPDLMSTLRRKLCVTPCDMSLTYTLCGL